MVHTLKLYAVVAFLAANCASGVHRESPPAATPIAVAPDTMWLIFVDDLHLDFRKTGRLRSLLTVISTELIRDVDMFAVASSGPSNLSIDVTADRTRLDTAIQSASGAGLSVADIVRPTRRPPAFDEVEYRAAVALSAAQKLLTSVEHVKSRRRAAIYISHGYNFDPIPGSPDKTTAATARLRLQFSALTAGARRAGVRIFAVDLLGIPADYPNIARAALDTYLATTQKNLRTMCEQTGGFAQSDGQNFSEMVKRVSSAMR